MWTEYAVIPLSLAVLAIVIVLVVRTSRIWLLPPAIRDLSKAGRSIEQSASLYKYSPELDAAIYKLIDSEYSKLRVAGDYLLTWRLHLTQETMDAQRKDIAPPLLNAVKALKQGDVLQLNDAFARLPVAPMEEDCSRADWRNSFLQILSDVSEHVASGNRSKWEDAASDLGNQVKYLPLEVRPPIYLLKGYLERPIKYTEVCLSRDKLKEQNQFLSRTVQILADECEKKTVNPENLWSVLATYGEKYRLPGRYADQ